MKLPSSPFLRRAGLWLAAGWLIVLVIVFYALRIPSLGVAVPLAHDLWDILAVALLVWLGGALGGLILPRPGHFADLERVAIQALLGLGAVSLIVLVLGLVGWFPPGWLAWLITLAALIILRRPALGWLAGLRAGFGQAFQIQSGSDHRPLLRTYGGWLIVGTLILLALCIIPALAPPTQWDSMVYHLTEPKLYIQAGRIIPYTEVFNFGYPFLTEMLYLWLMLMARAQAAALLHSTFGLLAALLLIGMGRRLDRPLAGWIALLALLLGNEIQNEFHVPYSDLSAAAYSTAGLWLVLAAFEENPAGDRRTLVWAGVVAGLALGTKYTAITVALGLGLVGLWLSRRGGLGGMLRAGAALAIPAVILFVPWLIKNALMYGNPVAPMIWGTAGFDRIDQSYYMQTGTGLRGVELVEYPLIFIFLGGIGDWFLFGSPGPLLPGLLPLALVGWWARPGRDRRIIAMSLLFAGVTVASWLIGSAITYDYITIRLMYPVFPALAMAAGLAVEGLAGLIVPIPVQWLARLAVLAAAAGSIVIVGQGLLLNPAPLQVALGQMSETDYLNQALPAYYEAIQQVNALPPNAHILMLWESRTFYCRRDCIPDTLLNRWRHDLLLDTTPERVVAGWRARGANYILISDAGMNAILHKDQRGATLLTQADVDALAGVRQADLRLIWRETTFQAYSLYQLP